MTEVYSLACADAGLLGEHNALLVLALPNRQLRAQGLSQQSQSAGQPVPGGCPGKCLGHLGPVVGQPGLEGRLRGLPGGQAADGRRPGRSGAGNRPLGPEQDGSGG